MARLLTERKLNQIDKAWVGGIRKTWKTWVAHAKTSKAKGHTYKKPVRKKPPARRTLISFLWKKFGYNHGRGKGKERYLRFDSPIPALGFAERTFKFSDQSDEVLWKWAKHFDIETARKDNGPWLPRSKERWESDYEAYRALRDETNRCLAILKAGTDFIDRLRTDLLINKGFWTRTDDSDKKSLEGMRTKAIWEMDHAAGALSDAKSKIEYWHRETQPQRGDRRDEVYGPDGDFPRGYRSIANWMNEGVSDADKFISGKLLRHISKLVTKAGGTIDWPSHEPDKIQIGPMNIFFRDSPMKGARLRNSNRDETSRGRSPRDRKKYISMFKRAYSILKRKKVGFLWQGTISVEPKSSRVNQLDPTVGVGGTYRRKGDHVTVYSDPSNWIVELMLHELGHKYWFKYMKSADRAHFSKWFGKVKAVSSYGGLSTSEDFAEVFAHYMLGRNMDRDQIDRFKSVLGKKRRLEDLLKDPRLML
jgi:hypothetical protein